MKQMRVNAARLHQNIAELAEIGGSAEGGVSRIAFSDADVEGREFVMDLMEQAGLAVRVDAVGNIFGRREGVDIGMPAILIGSHIDTVPIGGAYDGALGVLAAIELAQRLDEYAYRNRHPLEIVAWSDEEGGMSGSRGYIGDLTEAELGTDIPAGISLGEGISRIGGDPQRLAEARCGASGCAAYLELHVEQGGCLEAAGIHIGVVTGIVGIRQYAVTIDGKANHAGTTPMDQRCDALLAASECVLAVDRTVRSIEGTHVATVGELTVFPGAPNVIPGQVNLTIELRDLDTAKIESIWRAMERELANCAIKHGTSVKTAVRHSFQGVRTAGTVQAAVADAAKTIGLTFRHMPSGAGHDAQNLARFFPTGMIFVPSAGGISHAPAEYTKPGDVENGANVLFLSYLGLDQAQAS